MSSEGDVWLGDAARAFAALHPTDDATRAAIAGLLGLSVSAPPAEPVQTQVGDSGRGSAPAITPAVDGTAPAPREETETAHPLDHLPLLTAVSSEAPRVTGWVADDSLPPVNAGHTASIPRYEPLLAPRSILSVVHALLAQDTGDGPIDVAAMVDAVAQRKPLPKIPLERRATLRLGAQLLLDVGDGMEPFLRDEEMLAEQVRRVVGKATPVYYFADCPLRGAGPGSVASWDRYRPPHPRTPVLVVSDFGIGGPPLHPRRSRPKEWARFAQRLADTECPVVGLTPYPPDRWPAGVARHIPLLTWDRGITVGTVITRTRR
jgi:hypothetical protein